MCPNLALKHHLDQIKAKHNSKTHEKKESWKWKSYQTFAQNDKIAQSMLFSPEII